MFYAQDGDNFVLRLEKNEEIVGTISDFCRSKDIASGFFTGIGALDYLSTGVYLPAEKRYRTKEVSGLQEVISCTGNVFYKENELILHAHICAVNEKNELSSGHLLEAKVGLTLEVYFFVLKGKYKKDYDPTTGLFLLTLNHKF